MGYKPLLPFNVSMRLLVPTETTVKGTVKKVFSEPKNSWQFFGSFRTFGGTENRSNDIYTVFDTARIDCWFNPQITADCRIYIEDTGEVYDIIGTPENIEMRNQYMQIRVEKVGGRA